MSQSSVQFRPPPTSSILAFVSVMEIFTMMLLPMPPYFMDMAITLNLVLPFLLVCISLFTHRLFNTASLPSILGLSIFFRLAITIAMFRHFLKFEIWHENYWKSQNDLFHCFMPSYLTDFIYTIGSGNLLFSSVLCFVLCVIPAIVMVSLFIASRWLKPQTKQLLQLVQEKQNASLITPEAANLEQEAIIQDRQIFSALRGTLFLLAIEAIVGLVVAICAASVTLTQAESPTQAVLRFWDFPLVLHPLVMKTKVLTFSLILGSEALTRGIPLLLISIALWLLLSRRDSKPRSLGEQFMETLTLHPYSLLFAALVLALIGLFTLLLGGQPGWYLILPISNILVMIAFSVFLAADVQEQETSLAQAIERHKALLGASLGIDPVSSIRLEVSDELSRRFHLHYIESVKLEELKCYPPLPKKPFKSWHAFNERLTFLKKRMKFRRTAYLCLQTEQETNSKLLYHLKTLYQSLEKELGYRIAPIQIQINDTLVNGQYRLIVSEEVQAQGEITLGEDDTLKNKAVQDLIHQVRIILLNTIKQP